MRGGAPTHRRRERGRSACLLCAKLTTSSTLLVATLLLTGCSWLVNRFAFHPEPLPRDAAVLLDPRIEEHDFPSLDGTRLHGLLLRASSPRRVVLYLHGNAGNVYHRIDDALSLLETGASVFLLSYRGYGKSDGSPTEQGVYDDARAALGLIEKELGYFPSETFVLGRSIGSAVAVDLAQDRNLAGLILITPLSTGKDMARQFGLGWLTWMIGNPFDSVSKIARVDVPTLFIHGDRDEVIPLELGRRLYEACPSEHKQLKIVDGAGHNGIVRVAGARYWTWIEEFMDDQRVRAVSAQSAPP